MRHAGLQPTRITYTSLLHECARLGRADVASEILQVMNLDVSASSDLLTAVVKMDPVNKGSRAPARRFEEATGPGGPGEEEGKPRVLGDLLVDLFGEAKQLGNYHVRMDWTSDATTC